MKEVNICIFNKRGGVTDNVVVEQIKENNFRMIENELFDCRLTKGTEFCTRLNTMGVHEIIEITKKSEFITRRFFLSPELKESDYRMLGNELMKRGGFWQVDFGGITTMNIPKNFEYDIDEIMKIWGINLTEITDE